MCTRECAADEADGETGAVSDGHGDEARENGKHKAERCAADIHEEFGERGVRAEMRRVNRVVVKEEGEGDEDAAADDEREHVRDAVHEVLVDLAPEAFLLGCIRPLCRIRTVRVIDGRRARESTVDELICLVDAVRNLRDDDAVSVKARHGDVLVRRNDDAVGSGDLLRCEDVLHARRAVRLDLDGDAAFLRVLFQALCRHKGVRDARGAGGDGEDLDVVGGRCALRALLRGARRGEGAVFLRVDEAAEFLDGLGGDECLLEVGIHNHGRKAGENGEVLVVCAVRCGNHEEEAARIAVHRGKVHAVGDGHGGEPCCLYAVALGVRGCNAVAEARRAARLTCEYVLDVLFLVTEVSTLFHAVREQADGCLLGGGGGDAESNALRVKKVVDMQRENPPFSLYCICCAIFLENIRIVWRGVQSFSKP